MPELAYIDAGSGSLIIQAIIASAIAIPLFFRNQIGRFVAVVRGRNGSNDRATPVDDGRKS